MEFVVGNFAQNWNNSRCSDVSEFDTQSQLLILTSRNTILVSSIFIIHHQATANKYDVRHHWGKTLYHNTHIELLLEGSCYRTVGSLLSPFTHWQQLLPHSEVELQFCHTLTKVSSTAPTGKYISKHKWHVLDAFFPMQGRDEQSTDCTAEHKLHRFALSQRKWQTLISFKKQQINPRQSKGGKSSPPDDAQQL